MIQPAFWTLGFALFPIIFSALASAQPQPEERGVLRNTPSCVAWKRELLESSALDNGLKTDQLVVADASGKVLYNWADGVYHHNTPHAMWSASKSLTGLLLATAIQQGRISLDDPMTKYVPARLRLKAEGRKELERIKMSNLLDMTSGIAWVENAHSDVRDLTLLPVMYGPGSQDQAVATLQLPFVAEPGAVWNYSSGNGTLIMETLKEIYGADYDDMPWKNLFGPLGMKSAHIEQDAAGTFLGAQYIYVSAEDLAKAGVLMLNDGVTLQGERLLPSGWLKFAQELVPSSTADIKTAADYKQASTYGRAGFWINGNVRGAGRPYPHAPTDVVIAEGLFGQVLMILPSQGLVVARTGHETDSSGHVDSVMQNTISCFKKGN